MSTFRSPPPAAAWRHREARTGFETVFFRPVPGGYRIDGSTTAVEDGRAWAVGYRIETDDAWVTRRARVTGLSESARRHVLLEHDGLGGWRQDGRPAPHLDGCPDVDLESSAMTNTLPVHRMRLPVGARAAVHSAYVRALDLAVERLEQEYARLTDDGTHQRYEYVAPRFDFSCRLVYDETGLVTEYPGIAVRAGPLRHG